MPLFDKIKRLGEGFYGEVWLAFDKALGVECAVKYIRLEKITDPTNFFKEPQMLETLRHENIVEVKAAGRLTDGRLYIQMEYLPNGSLKDIFKGEAIPLTKAIQIICNILRGLEYAHGKGYIHRDIKPANVLMTEKGAAKISDFGLATRIDARGEASPYGYIAHLAPEVFTGGRTTIESDIYAVGVTLYRLINGDSYLPDISHQDELESAVINGKYPDRSYYRLYIPRSLKTIINRAINVDPRLRYKNASSFRYSLEQVEIGTNWQEVLKPNSIEWIGKYKRRSILVKLNHLLSPEMFSLQTFSKTHEAGEWRQNHKLSKQVIKGETKAFNIVSKILQSYVNDNPVNSL